MFRIRVHSHSEPDELRLVEVLRQVPRLERVNRAEYDQQEVPHERRHERERRGIAHEDHSLGHEVRVEARLRELLHHADGDDDALDADEDPRDYDLKLYIWEIGQRTD